MTAGISDACREPASKYVSIVAYCCWADVKAWWGSVRPPMSSNKVVGDVRNLASRSQGHQTVDIAALEIIWRFSFMTSHLLR